MNIDLASIEQQAFLALGGVLMGALIWIAQRVAARLNISITAANSAALEDLAAKSLAYGLTRVQGTIAAKGWDHVDVKRCAIAAAATYAIAKFPAGLAAVGIDPDDPAAGQKLSQGILTRMFPQAVTVAAASPATPPAPAATVPAAPIVVAPASSASTV